MFGNCCNTCCPADSNRGLFGICLNGLQFLWMRRQLRLRQ